MWCVLDIDIAIYTATHCRLSRRPPIWLLDLQAEIYVLHRLVYRASTQYVDLCSGGQTPTFARESTAKPKLGLTVYSPFMQVSLRDVPAALEEELALPSPLLPESPCNPDELRALNIVEHDDVRARVDRFVRLFLGADLDLEEKAKPANLARLLDSIRD